MIHSKYLYIVYSLMTKKSASSVSRWIIVYRNKAHIHAEQLSKGVPFDKPKGCKHRKKLVCRVI